MELALKYDAYQRIEFTKSLRRRPDFLLLATNLNILKTLRSCPC